MFRVSGSILIPFCFCFLTFTEAFAQTSHSGPAPVPSRVQDVVDKAQVAEIIHSFQLELNRIGFTGQITGCDHVINVFYPIGGHDSSYAAYCSIRSGDKRLSYWMCNDWMIGKFTFGGSEAITRDGGVSFVIKNCSPGG
jgi:hypothetical protein